MHTDLLVRDVEEFWTPHAPGRTQLLEAVGHPDLMIAMAPFSFSAKIATAPINRLETEGLLHMELAPRLLDPRAVFGTGVGSERGGGRDPAEVGW